MFVIEEFSFVRVWDWDWFVFFRRLREGKILKEMLELGELSSVCVKLVVRVKDFIKDM